MSLPTLPYDLLFHIAQYLDVDDIHSLQATCKSLRSFALTRPVYRSLAHALLCRSRPLPLPAFRRLADISTDNLIKAVDRAHTFEKAWRVRAPRPARSSPLLTTPDSSLGAGKHQGRWYIKISAPPNEEIDWLSPITASYTLCATKSGRVVCWDVARDVCLAEWDPRSLIKWELWKCRVEFDERAVYFTMARVLKGSYDDNRVMEFVLMKLAFPPETDIAKPTFLPLTSFYTTGVVMNVFLLDPPKRLLSAFVWLASSNTIGLYVLLDWDKDEYIYVDTGVGCLISSNWSCILHNDQIVIHSEEADAAYQHFYPLGALRGYSRPRNGALKLSIFVRRHHLPSVSARLPPIRSVSKKFVFPRVGATPGAGRDVPSSTPTTLEAFSLLDVQPVPGPSSSAGSPSDDGNIGDPVDEDTGSPEPAPNPYPFPPWYPESAHFVRQWWPTLPGVPRLSCTVVLLAAHHPETHRTRFVLAQHYFKVPITRPTNADKLNSGSSAGEDDGDDDDEMLHLWYVSTPFEVVCVLDSPADNGDDEDTGDRPRPLVAVDFGHAVWVEYAAEPGGVYGVDASRLCLRFVTFPPVHTANDRQYRKGHASGGDGRTREGAIVRTLEIPEELDLDGVETINIDQSQGAVILSVKEGKIFILRYE
ncbi:hypothetical protein EDD17DRAFT_1487095 [Pisolithus thermaeus]|nr:hypothetical protein EV401DRAFT_1863149 [Pisolithus croceorrhizus]KAI6159239.1 hypothetical protein EDD17DRAFT_1487095 [Pisolithus thermaeus]